MVLTIIKTLFDHILTVFGLAWVFSYKLDQLEPIVWFYTIHLAQTGPYQVDQSLSI